MLIQQIKLVNLFTFFGEQAIQLPVNRETNLTVILARNSSGKTNLIRALRFLFYGLGSSKEAELIVNREALRRAAKDDYVEAWAGVIFHVGHRKFTLRRSVGVRKAGNNVPPTVVDNKVALIKHDQERDLKIIEPDVVRGRIEEILPEALFDFFFFKGEELTTRLLDRQDTGISNGLSEVLYRGKWKSAIDSLTSAERGLAADVRAVKGQSEQYHTMLSRKDHFIKEQDKYRALLKKLTEEGISLTASYESLDEEYITASASSSRQLKDKYNSKKNEAQNLERFIESLETQLRRDVGDSGGIFFLRDAFLPAQETLATLQKKGLLPPDISQALVKRLLTDKTCICGESLGEGTSARKEVERYRKESIEHGLSHELFHLLSKIETGFPEKRKRRIQAVCETEARIATEREKLLRAETDVKAIERQYDEKAAEEAEGHVRSLKIRRDQVREQLNKIASEKANVEMDLRSASKSLDDVMRELGRTEHVPDAAKRLLSSEKLLLKLRQHAEFCRVQMESSFQRYLQEHTRKLYSEVVVDHSDACIDPNSLLPSIRWNDVGGYVAGGGQQQTLVLAYIASLSQLRKYINAELRRYFAIGEVAEQCFFMDSVFGPMEGAYREKVCSAIPSKMKQLVLLLAPQQWDDSVRRGLEGQISKAYRFHLFTDHFDNQDAITVDFKGRRVELATIDKSHIESYTKIEALEV